MKKFFVGAALLGTTLAAAPASAQTAGEPVTAGHGSFYLSPYAGYMIFGNLFTFADGTEYSNEDGGLYGAQLGYSLRVQGTGDTGHRPAPVEPGEGGVEAVEVA